MTAAAAGALLAPRDAFLVPQVAVLGSVWVTLCALGHSADGGDAAVTQ